MIYPMMLQIDFNQLGRAKDHWRGLGVTVTINWIIKPLSIIALLATLVLIFAFQGYKTINNPLAILLIAVPLTLQTYFIFFAAWFTGKALKLPFNICAPSALIGSSNFFELAVAVAISIFGLNSGATLATVVGVLIEVPVMLSLVKIANKHKY